MAFRCDAAFAEVRTKEKAADCMHALMGSKNENLRLNSIADLKGQRMTQNINSVCYSFAGSVGLRRSALTTGSSLVCLAGIPASVATEANA